MSSPHWKNTRPSAPRFAPYTSRISAHTSSCCAGVKGPAHGAMKIAPRSSRILCANVSSNPCESFRCQSRKSPSELCTFSPLNGPVITCTSPVCRPCGGRPKSGPSGCRTIFHGPGLVSKCTPKYSFHPLFSAVIFSVAKSTTNAWVTAAARPGFATRTGGVGGTGAGAEAVASLESSTSLKTAFPRSTNRLGVASGSANWIASSPISFPPQCSVTFSFVKVNVSSSGLPNASAANAASVFPRPFVMLAEAPSITNRTPSPCPSRTPPSHSPAFGASPLSATRSESQCPASPTLFAAESSARVSPAVPVAVPAVASTFHAPLACQRCSASNKKCGAPAKTDTARVSREIKAAQIFIPARTLRRKRVRQLLKDRAVADVSHGACVAISAAALRKVLASLKTYGGRSLRSGSGTAGIAAFVCSSRTCFTIVPIVSASRMKTTSLISSLVTAWVRGWPLSFARSGIHCGRGR